MWQFLVSITPTLNLLLSMVTGIIALFRLVVRKGLWVRLSSLLICLVCSVLWFGEGRQIGVLLAEFWQLLVAFASIMVISTFYIEEIRRRKHNSHPLPRRSKLLIGLADENDYGDLYEAYCLNRTCKKMVPMKHPRRIKTKNGRWRLQDTCPYCGIETSRFIN